MFVIHLTPQSTGFKPHIWKEGGEFFTKKGAEFHAKQIRKMKDLYKKVVVIPKKNDNPKQRAKDTTGKL